MAGVAGPMVRRSAREGTRFLAGLVAGGTAAGVVLALPTYLLSTAAHAAMPPALRWSVLAAICLLLGAADLANRIRRSGGRCRNG